MKVLNGKCYTTAVYEAIVDNLTLIYGANHSSAKVNSVDIHKLTEYDLIPHWRKC